jgi:hypothetical protein
MAQRKPPRRRWQKDPSAIYRVMGMQQLFTTAEQVKLNLPIREALQSLRDGDGNDTHWHTLAAVVNVCLLRGERIAPEVMQCAKDGQMAVLSIKDRFDRTGKWGVSHSDLVNLEACIDLHEQLIELSTPAQMLQAFRDVIDRMNAGHVIRKDETV